MGSSCFGGEWLVSELALGQDGPSGLELCRPMRLPELGAPTSVGLVFLRVGPFYGEIWSPGRRFWAPDEDFKSKRRMLGPGQGLSVRSNDFRLILIPEEDFRSQRIPAGSVLNVTELPSNTVADEGADLRPTASPAGPEGAVLKDSPQGPFYR